MFIQIILVVIPPPPKTYFSRNGVAESKSEVIFETKPGMIYNLVQAFYFLRMFIQIILVVILPLKTYFFSFF